MDNWFSVSKIDDNTFAINEDKHWDHIGGHKYFDNIAVHEAEKDWLSIKFPIPLQAVKHKFITGRLPAGYGRNGKNVPQGLRFRRFYGTFFISEALLTYSALPILMFRHFATQISVKENGPGTGQLPGAAVRGRN